MRTLLLRGQTKGHTSYIYTSLACVAAFIVAAASATIANHAIARNVVVRSRAIPGRFVNNLNPGVGGLEANVSTRRMALERANVPLEELLDFVPDDSSNWIY